MDQQKNEKIHFIICWEINLYLPRLSFSSVVDPFRVYSTISRHFQRHLILISTIVINII